ncbi:unnamed protein product [Coccothraustes coccothraustes]
MAWYGTERPAGAPLRPHLLLPLLRPTGPGRAPYAAPFRGAGSAPREMDSAVVCLRLHGRASPGFETIWVTGIRVGMPDALQAGHNPQAAGGEWRPHAGWPPMSPAYPNTARGRTRSL